MSKDIVDTIPDCPEWLLNDLNAFFRNQAIAESAAVETRQRRLAKELGGERKSINGLGQPVMELDEFILARWRDKLGYNPIKDSGWRKYMTKHFPECRVSSLGTKEIFVGYGSKGFGVKQRFKKSYG